MSRPVYTTKRLKLPIVAGEIIVGIIIGRSGFGWVGHEEEILTLLSELGFVFLMFLSGMEIDFSSLGFESPGRRDKDQPRSPVMISAIMFGLTLILSLLVGFGLLQMDFVNSPWMIALILSTTSLGVVVPVLKEQGLSQGRYGQTILISSLIADFATMLLITVLVTALSKGLTFDILLIGLLFVAFFLFYYFGERLFNEEGIVRRVMDEISQATAQIKIRAAFTMMLIFVALAEMLGTEIILGAFLGGAVLSLLSTPEDEELLHRLDAMGYGFFIPIFFIMVGVDFNLASLLSSSRALLLLPLLLTAAAAVKFIPALVYKMNYDWKKTLGAGSILSSRLSLIIAASAIGLRLGVISEPINAATDLPMLLGLLTRNPSLYDLLTRTESDREVCEITVWNREYLNKPLRDLDLPGDLVIMAVRKEEELIVPRGDTKLNVGDMLTVLGSGDCVENTRRLFSG
jgi:Kef-type K+ transport system membrane component KefB